MSGRFPAGKLIGRRVGQMRAKAGRCADVLVVRSGACRVVPKWSP
jgi:hypothetical protein